MAFDHADLVLSLCTGLGTHQELPDDLIIYKKGPDCVDCLKDLQRFLRRDDPDSRDVFFFLGQMDLPRNDLVPLITTYPNDSDIVYNALKVLTFLTMPVEAGTFNTSLQADYIEKARAAVVEGHVLQQMAGFLASHLPDSVCMGRESILRLQLFLLLVRNLLIMPEGSGFNRTQTSIWTQEKLIDHLFEANVVELLLAVSQHAGQPHIRDEAPLLLSIFYHLYNNVDPEKMLAAKWTKSVSHIPQPPKQAVHASMARQRSVDRKRRQPVASRRLRYGGHFVQRHNDHTHDIITKACQPVEIQMAAPQHKVFREPEKATTSNRILACLRQSADAFLLEAYGLLMPVVQKALAPGLGISVLQRDDFLHYLKVARFFIQYVCLKLERSSSAHTSINKDPTSQSTTSPFSCISATVGWELFHMVRVMWLSQTDIPGKSEDKDWELQRASLGLLKELLFALHLAHKQGTDADKKAANRLQRRLLHDDMRESGLLPVLGRLIRGFSKKYQGRQDATDMVEALHVVLETYEKLSSEEGGKFYVAKKARAKRKQTATDGTEMGSDPTNNNGGFGEDCGKDSADRVSGAGTDGCEENGGTQPSKDGEQLPKEPHCEGQERTPLEELLGKESSEDEESEGNNTEQLPSTKEVYHDFSRRLHQEVAHPDVVSFYIGLLNGNKLTEDATPEQDSA
ncbi:unnamed protein product [Ostreobium quekettii]|uniref:Timeless N-terminal domain-containing protein n=1 Tax=Ostreobium quekettii TaxID=121088 RepID=A0A8S1INT7_9CHLO|nr:unnamed protein product [Ostreobium quekettii]